MPRAFISVVAPSIAKSSTGTIRAVITTTAPWELPMKRCAMSLIRMGSLPNVFRRRASATLSDPDVTGRPGNGRTTRIGSTGSGTGPSRANICLVD